LSFDNGSTPAQGLTGISPCFSAALNAADNTVTSRFTVVGVRPNECRWSRKSAMSLVVIAAMLCSARDDPRFAGFCRKLGIEKLQPKP
jgi:hypothetical protein